MPPEPPAPPNPPSYRRFIVLGMALVVLAVVAGIWLLLSVGDTPPGPSTEQQVLGTVATTTRVADATRTSTSAPATTRATDAKATTTTARPGKDAAGLTIVRPAQLPKEAQQTLALVDAGGPFPYDKDGTVFQNREKLLPAKPSGYYREYTVVTPGSSDRGERRIVAGRDGERYYTADHYESFVRVLAAS